MSDFAELRQKLHEMGQGYEEFKALHAKFIADKDSLINDSVKRATEDLAKKHDDLSDTVEKLATRLNRTAGNAYADTDANDPKKLAADMDSFQKARVNSWNGKAGFGEHTMAFTADEYRAYTSNFSKFMRYGDSKVETKSLSVGSDADGGAWIVPPTIMNTIVQRIFETSPLRDVALVVPLGTHSLKIPVNPNQFSAGWVAEQTARTTTNTPAIAMKEIVAQELYAEPPVSQQLLEDSSIDVEAWVGRLTGDKISRVENTSFVSGTGIGQPRGFLTYPAGSGAADVAHSNANLWGQIQQVGTGSSGAFSYSGLINLITSLKDPYQANASFLIRRQSVASIMLLQDGNGRYIFQPILNGSFNNTPLFGYPMRYATDMPAPASGSLSLAFADWKQAYYIVDRVGISMIRDNVTQKPFVLFYMRKRTGGDVVDFDAIKLQVLT